MSGYRANNFLDTEAIEGVSSVAVLPFHNLSKQVNAGVIVTNMLMAELIQHDQFQVVKYGDLRNFFLQRRMIVISSVDIKVLRALRQEFRVDAVIMGTVLQYEDGGGSTNNKKNVPPSIAINSKILDTRTGRILAKGEFMEKGSATGYLLSDRDRQLAFALARDFAQKLISKIGTHGA
ncbi:MAG: CsgG/HfaB family protein [bacterium]